jgi:hypothetical protein
VQPSQVVLGLVVFLVAITVVVVGFISRSDLRATARFMRWTAFLLLCLGMAALVYSRLVATQGL